MQYLLQGTLKSSGLLNFIYKGVAEDLPANTCN